ncbi:MAG TPA: hypothetical protein DEG17_11565 [Cyanobacteria bacterium UBA11149]|nr:hypothetical protein [Cyanobacteria bacterium UBA11366]HBK65260.1 hypothetical protein [Cyanobacteria bacterium UBA11166]HBR74046.1 hypothetical protein [Cyanobacteria bacterium UBA11159]HBS69668.1 hypothetical protein [Cyanobacteria bacterium UBA11153]HBW89485.1 hypothetical protein [Cyanobacteria bacterium UBA11149]HCA94030.1 hypothetical protein [Cyanobacteria bacterium UBA9226]
MLKHFLRYLRKSGAGKRLVSWWIFLMQRYASVGTEVRRGLKREGFSCLNWVHFYLSRMGKFKAIAWFVFTVLVVHFYHSFLIKTLPVVAQSPPEIRSIDPVSNPENLIEKAKQLYASGQFTEALTILEQASQAFAAKGDNLGQATALDLQGQVYLTQGQSETAVEKFVIAGNFYEQGNDEDGVIKSKINQAQALRKGGFYRRSLEVLVQLNESLAEKPDTLLKGIALRSLGITQRLIGNLDEAEKAVTQSLAIAQSQNSPSDISAAYLMLGNIAKDRGNFTQDRGGNQINNQLGTNRSATDYFKAAINNYQKAAENATNPTAIVEAKLNQLSILGDAKGAGEILTETGEPFINLEGNLLSEISTEINQLPLSISSVHARINWARLARDSRNLTNINPQDIENQLILALQQAKILKDPRSESYALGELGQLRQEEGKKAQAEGKAAEGQKKLQQAQENTQKALAIAQSIDATDIAYRWQWQLGQIMKDRGNAQGAIAAYDAAVNNLGALRGDLVTVNPDVQFSFRETVEPVYRQFVDLLLESADKDNTPENLEKARTVIESLQQAELVNFFRENCLNASQVKIDEIDKKAAVIYPIVLDKKLEVVVSLPGSPLRHHTIDPGVEVNVNEVFNGLRQAISPEVLNPINRSSINEPETNPNPQEENPGKTQLNPTENPEETRGSDAGIDIVPKTEVNPNYQEKNAGETQLKDSGIKVIKNNQNPTETPKSTRGNGPGIEIILKGQTETYKKLAQQVYNWIIAPFEADIQASEVETLVFVLDGPLLNLPMAVLMDGNEKLLVEKYAIAYTPGLQLLDSKPLVRGEVTALKAGLSEERELKVNQGATTLQFPALYNVERELTGIQKEVPGEIMLNQDFTTAAIQEAIDAVPFPIIHLSTHGIFSSNQEDTFILTSDDRLNVEQLNQVLRGREEGGKNPIELLVLSACQTATGDERAALGLAGVAVRAGARSTLATLWVVDDEGTANLMIKFYEELKDPNVSKAEALRRAQLWLMAQDERFKKPYYWAPFVLIGNWK